MFSALFDNAEKRKQDFEIVLLFECVDLFKGLFAMKILIKEEHTMKTKTKKWHKTCLVDNCEVVGFNRLHDLMPDQYGKKNYCLCVLVNRTFGENLLKEIREEERKAEREFGCEVRSFKRITNEIDEKLCPYDKMVLNLSTDSKHGAYTIGIFDENNNPVIEPITTLAEGSIISIHFDLDVYKTNSVGVSLKLKDIKINRADLEIANKVRCVSPFQKQDFFEETEIFLDEMEDEEI